MSPIFQNLILHSDLARRLLGITPDVGRQMDRAQLYFASGWPLRAAAVLLLAGAVWFGYFYVKDGVRPSLWVKTPLLLLRLLALAAMTAMLLQPMLRIEHNDRQRSSVVVLVDTSQSMGFPDPRLPADRAAEIRRATGGDPLHMTRAEVVERLSNSPSVQLLGTLAKRYNVR